MEIGEVINLLMQHQNKAAGALVTSADVHRVLREIGEDVGFRKVAEWLEVPSRGKVRKDGECK
jgi:hypothetical protein